MSISASNRGIADTVIDGICRDVPTIRRLKYPIFTKGCFMMTDEGNGYYGVVWNIVAAKPIPTSELIGHLWQGVKPWIITIEGSSMELKFRSGDTDDSSLPGNSGTGELGVIFRPYKSNDSMLMRLGVQGYIGAHEGASGILKRQYAF